MLNLLSEMHLNYFKQSYGSCRNQFLESLNNVSEALIVDRQEFAHPLAGPQGEALFCDVVFLGQKADPDNVLVLISGTHGVEGFTGSAVQTDNLSLLSDVLLEQPDLGVVMIHAMNPWGFAWVRRCDHEGIDLNRNFIDFNEPLPIHAGYESLSMKLDDLDSLSQEGLETLWDGMDFNEFVEQATRGQYQDAAGLFYGGSQPSWSRRVLEEITEHGFFKTAQRISVIDVHTGLGPYGYGEIINDHQPDSGGFYWAKHLYGDNAYSAHLGESCSAPKLGLLDYHWHEVVGDRGCFVTLEYGTYAVKDLIAELLKEQLYHQSLKPGQTRDVQSTTVQSMKAFFYPFEPSWQQQVLFRARQVIAMALAGMTE